MAGQKVKSNLRTPPGCLPGETAKQCRDRRKGLKSRPTTARQVKKAQEG